MTKAKTRRVTALTNIMTLGSVVVPQGTAVDLPTEEADRLLELGHVREGDANDKAEEPVVEPSAPAKPADKPSDKPA